MNKIVQIIPIVLLGVLNSCVATAQIIPSGNSDFYYKLGGGEAIPVPVFMSETSIPLNVEANIGLNYNCGSFNPLAAITDSLNNIKNSFQNMEQQTISNATSAITEFPMYEIARANGPLYNLLNNGLFGARKDLEVSTKSCQVMKSEIAAGQNPYKDWATVSMGNDWTYHMNMASGDGLQGGLDSANDDINQVKTAVQKDNGDKGVPWVRGVDIGRGGKYAGGKDQPNIRVIYDTSVAGYNVALQSGRGYDDTSAPAKTSKNTHLVDTWTSPDAAAKWLTNVVGDEEITTYSGGDKSSTPGVGLLPQNVTLTSEIQSKLIKLISSTTDMSLQNLQAVSAPHVMINQAVINSIRIQTPTMRAIVVGKLAQEIATARLIDKAQLALQLLEQGRQVPSIYSNKAAQSDIQKAVDSLHQDVNDFLFNIKVNKQLVSNTVSGLMQVTQAKQLGDAVIQTGNKPGVDMEHGAIQQDEQTNAQKARG